MQVSKLEKLMSAVYTAKERMKKGLEFQYPVGAPVEVILNFSQGIPTKGVVVGHSWDGYVLVKITTAKEHNRLPCRRVYFTQVYPG